MENFVILLLITVVIGIFYYAAKGYLDAGTLKNTNKKMTEPEEGKIKPIVTFKVTSRKGNRNNGSKRPTKKKKTTNIDTSFTVVDVETAQGKRNSICQIGVVRVESNRIVETYSSLIQPPNNEYQFRNTSVHGIDATKTKDSPFFPEVWKEIKHWFENTTVVAHSIAFDSDCLYQTLKYYDIEIPKYNEDCTYNRSHLKLEELAVSLDLNLVNHHDALADAVVCAQAYIKLIAGIKPNLSLIEKQLIKQTEEHDAAVEVLEKKSDYHFEAKKFLFTGRMNVLDRVEAKEITKKLGGKITTSISKGLDYVIMGEAPGPKKLRDLEELNSNGAKIKIITEQDFLQLIR